MNYITLQDENFSGRLVALKGLSSPNRASDLNAVAAETYLYLQLENPICDYRGNSRFLIRLLLQLGDFSQTHQLLDTDVEVTGELSEQIAPQSDVPHTMLVKQLLGTKSN